ncbi:DUF2264 domain-containing protein [Chthonobacter albigriseus]|uniref:DUF2264 domain-containing protein n=1 Tax=Chthonobacter albigriseus TaxID=1683161 RepID=UPI0015EFB960|nr:DUF2264 domain-containing protein [Chthonobacter albigriseus]
MRRWIAALSVLVLAGVLSAAIVRRDAVDGWSSYRAMSERPTAADRAAAAAFLDGRAAPAARFEALFGYFLAGFVANASADFARVDYTGLPSDRGFRVSGLEGFARTAPLLGAWIHSGRPAVIPDPASGEPVDLVAVLRQGILAGTDPDGPSYWGDVRGDDQRIVESADIARLLWLTRPVLWDRLGEAEQAQVAAWLLQAVRAEITFRNNWDLFQVVVATFLDTVGRIPQVERNGYRTFIANLRESGWFTDGPTGEVDFYNAWGISYDLFWIHQMKPDFDPAFLVPALVESGRLTAHLVSPRGIPILGRSACYRTAVPSPVLAASMLDPAAIPPGLARRALDATWTYFVERDVLRDGSLTMGYLETDLRLVDRYTGPGSCHWGLRSLTLAIMQPPVDPFWTAPAVPLPVERADFRLDLPKLGWVVSGSQETGEIRIEIPANTLPAAGLEDQSLSMKLWETLRQRPARPPNDAARYGLNRYSSADPYGSASGRP